MAKRLNRLLAALAATATLATGITASAWAGTATATEYITIQPESGTTLDGRTFNAYRLGTYGDMEIAPMTEVGVKYAKSIQINTDGTYRKNLAESAKKAGFDTDDPLQTAWDSTDSGKLAAFVKTLAAALADEQPNATKSGAGDIGPLTPGVYLLTSSDGSACLSGTLTGQGISDGRHEMGIAEFSGDRTSAKDIGATSDGDLMGTVSNDGISLLSANGTENWHSLFEGSITSTASDNEDPAISIYTGGNLKMVHNLETEGSVIVNGNLTGGIGLVSGKVSWGMGYTPPKNAVTLAVGGNYTSSTETTSSKNWPSSFNRGWTSANAQIGGTDKTIGVIKDEKTVEANSLRSGWLIEGQTNPTATSNMGREKALKVNIDGKGTIVDYNDYVEKQLQPVSTQLAKESTTGGVTYSKAAEYTQAIWDDVIKGQHAVDTVDVSDEGIITFTGDGKNHRQVFNLDLDELAAQKKKLNVKQWGVDFNNVGDSAAIVVNIKGTGSRTWNTGWRYRVNGKDVSLAVAKSDGTYQDFRKLASRLMWNWVDATDVTLDEAHGTLHISKAGGHSLALEGKDSYKSTGYSATNPSAGKAANVPGSILAPKASMTVNPDTNGRLLVGKDLTLDVWEHHNNPWIGFNDQYSTNVQASTDAAHTGADLGTTSAVHDAISVKNDSKTYGAKIAKITVRLNYSKDTDGTTASQSAVKTTSAVTVGAGSTATVNSPDFTPSDLEMSAWQAGRYWFDISVTDSDVSLTGLTANETANIHDSQSLNGLDDQSEQWTIQPGATPSIGTKAVASGATAGGTQPVHDSITVTNPDPNRAVTLAKVTTTLHVKGGKTASKTVTGKTIPAGGSLTFDSATFTPSDLGDKTWKAGVTYWFDATVKASDASYPSGAQALTADLNHDGSNDAAQQFKLTMDADFSTQAQDTFTQAGGTGAVHDRLLLKSGSDALTADLDVKVTLNWNASPTGTAGTKSLTKAGVFKAGAASSDLPDFTPSDFGWTSWKGGRYWYDVTIPAQKDIIEHDKILNGLKNADTTAAESWTAAVPWTLDLAKLAYIGQPGSGRWDDEPVKGATFTLTETTDRHHRQERTRASDGRHHRHRRRQMVQTRRNPGPIQLQDARRGHLLDGQGHGFRRRGDRHRDRLGQDRAGAAQKRGRFDPHGRRPVPRQHHAPVDRRHV